MFKIGRNEFEGQTLYFFSIAEEDVGSEFRVTLTGAGAAFATIFTEDDLEDSLELWKSCRSLDLQEMAATFEPNKPYIFINNDDVKHLTASELMAVVYHEIGHIVNGDAERALAQEAKGLVTSMTMELEADQYAVERVGAVALKSALLKLFDMYANVINRAFGAPLDEVITKIYGDPATVARLDALDKAIKIS